MIHKLFLILLTYGTVAMSAPISCGKNTSDFRVQVSSDWQTAVVTINSEIPGFGTLVCRPPQQRLNDPVFLICSSPYVADAGYQATFSAQSPTDATVELEEFWIGGARLLDVLPCAMAMHE